MGIVVVVVQPYCNFFVLFMFITVESRVSIFRKYFKIKLAKSVEPFSIFRPTNEQQLVLHIDRFIFTLK